MQSFEIDTDDPKFLKWKKRQYKIAKSTNAKTKSGDFTYMFTPNGIGYSIIVKCNLTDQTIDMTDFSTW